jgi:hypothetical protein
MALSYQLSEIENWRELLYADGVLPTTQRVIFATMAVGLGRITEKNLAEFWTRVRMIEAIDGVHKRLTLADIQRHIGLRTNVGDETKTQWLKRIYDYALREAAREVKRAADR